MQVWETQSTLETTMATLAVQSEMESVMKSLAVCMVVAVVALVILVMKMLNVRAGALQAVTEAPGLWRNPGPAFNPIWTEASVVQAHLAVYREVLARRSSASRASSRRADPAQV